MSPNADLKCTAKQAMADAYWQGQKRGMPRTVSLSDSFFFSGAFEKDMDRLLPSAWERCQLEEQEYRREASP